MMEKGRCKIPEAKKVGHPPPSPGAKVSRVISTFQKTAPADVSASFTLAPNPTSGITTLSVAASEAELPVTVLNLQGQTVRKAVLPEGHNTVALDLGGLPAGVYLVRTQQADGRYNTQRLVKE